VLFALTQKSYSAREVLAAYRRGKAGRTRSSVLPGALRCKSVLTAIKLLGGRPLPRACRGVHLNQEVFSIFVCYDGSAEETSPFSYLLQGRYKPKAKLLFLAKKVVDSSILISTEAPMSY